jgi:Ran GTPase-activating protein (RanGAP) involved in mRNA processing and transport
MNLIAKAIRFHSSLSELDLSYNTVDHQFSELLVEGLKSNRNLRRINLRGIRSRLGISFGLLFENLASNSSLRFLDCSENSISEDSIEKLAESLKLNSSLQEILLSRNNIDDSSVLKLYEALYSNTTLQIVDLSLNPISDTGASAISDLLKKTQSTSLLMINITKELKASKSNEELSNSFVINENIWNDIIQQLLLIHENRTIASRIAPLAICYHTKQYSDLCKLRFDKNIIKMILIPLLRNHLRVRKSMI